MHKVLNLKERKLLLALSSGRINVRKFTCPVPGCKKSTSRLDRHLRCHTELTQVAQHEAMKACKRKQIIEHLASLRSSNPEEPMVSTLDLDEAQDVWDVPTAPEEEEEEECDKASCKAKVKNLQDQVADLNHQVDSLTGALKDVSRRYRLLRKRSHSTPSSQVARVTRNLLSTLSSPGEEGPEQPVAEPVEEPAAGPSKEVAGPSKEAHSANAPHPFPDHVAVLSEYKHYVMLL